jgi:hypothetical protein
VDVSEPDRGIIPARIAQRARHAPIPRGGDEPDHEGNAADDRGRLRETFHRLPDEEPADREETNGIEEVRNPEGIPREPAGTV